MQAPCIETTTAIPSPLSLILYKVMMVINLDFDLIHLNILIRDAQEEKEREKRQRCKEGREENRLSSSQHDL